MSAAHDSTEQVIPLEPIGRKFAERYSLLTHFVVAASLLQEAIPAIRSSPGDAGFAWIEALAASALIIAAIRDVRFKRSHEHETVAWTEMFAGLVLIVEAAIKWREGPRHYPLAVARSLVALLVIGLGMSHARLKEARSLRIDKMGIRWRRRLLFSYSVDWADLQAVSVTDRTIVFDKKNRDGPTLQIGRLTNSENIRDAIVTAAARHGISVSDKRLK